MIWVSSFLNIKPQTLILWVAAIILLLIISALALILWSVPDPRVFNDNIEKVFLENDFSTQTEIKLLEVLASSGSLFESSISLYSSIIFTLVIITISMMVISFGSLMSNIHLRQQFVALKNSALQVNAIELSRAENSVKINGDWLHLTKGSMETLSVLLEATLDGDFLSGLDVETLISGKNAADCEDAAGVMRIKRLRDNIGNQIVAQHLIQNIPGKGYQIKVSKNIIVIN